MCVRVFCFSHIPGPARRGGGRQDRHGDQETVETAEQEPESRPAFLPLPLESSYQQGNQRHINDFFQSFKIEILLMRGRKYDVFETLTI